MDEVIGVVEAPSREAETSPAFPRPAAARPAEVIDASIRRRDLAAFANGLAALQRAGIPLLRALHNIADSTRSRRFRDIQLRVADRIEGGSSFSEALGEFPRAFDPIFIHSAAVGESTGKLDEVLARLAEHLEREEDLKAQVQGALAYPAFSFAVTMSIVAFILVGVVPRFMKAFVKTGVPLPLPTRMVLGTSSFVREEWLSIAGGILAAGVLWSWAMGEPGFRRWFDAAKMRIPVVGSIILRLGLMRFAQSLGLLIHSGIPILSALDLVRGVVGNSVLAENVGGLSDHISQGGKIGEYIRRSPLFPPMACLLLSSGEASGNLAGMLGEIGRLYAKETERALKVLVGLLEPILIVVMGLTVGGILIALLLPMFTMMQGFGR